MRRTQTRKLLRISTFLAVSVGLAMGTSAAAEPPTDQTDSSPQIEIAERDADDPEIDHDEHVQLDENVDYPGDIEDFADFVREHQQEGIDEVPEYTHEGAEHMADAMQEVIPGDEGLFEDRPEEYQHFDDELDEWEERVDELAEYDHDDYSQLASDVLDEGAQWLTSLQQQAYPELTEQVEAVQNAADEIDPEVDIDEQGDSVEAYFVSAVTAIDDMWVTHTEDPLTMTSGDNLRYAQMEHDEPGMEDDPAMEEQPEMDDAVQTYIDHIDEADREDFEGEQGQQNVVDTLGYLDDALATYIEETPAIEEEDPVLEGAQYDGADEEPGIEDEPGIEEEADELTELHEEFQNNLEQLEEYVGEDEFTEYMEMTMNNSAELLTNIQTNQFPDLTDEADEVREAVEDIDTDVEFDDLTSEIMDFFDANKDALEAMEEERPDPVTLSL